METQKLFRGRLIDHLQLVVRDLEASRRFYKAVFEVLEVPIGGETKEHFWVDELFVSGPDSPEAEGVLTGRTHLAFQAKDQTTVQRAHAAMLAAGGKDHGAPGERPYHPGYYAAFAIAPDGNNIEVVYHGPAKRSTEAIELTFEA